MAGAIGILGGMGPLASAELLWTFYRLHDLRPEQNAPACILVSDPSIPDRTAAILGGDPEPVVRGLTAALETLAATGADPLVIACVTAHHFLPGVPEPLRRRVVSLIDLAVSDLLADPRPRLLLATHGTRRARLFEGHPQWGSVAPWILEPGEEDQASLHDRLYRLKEGEPTGGFLDWLDGLAARTGAEGFLFGCTELHLLQREAFRRHGGRPDPRIVDPLVTAARELAAGRR
jgi:aspartate racemase